MGSLSASDECERPKIYLSRRHNVEASQFMADLALRYRHGNRLLVLLLHIGIFVIRKKVSIACLVVVVSNVHKELHTGNPGVCL